MQNVDGFIALWLREDGRYTPDLEFATLLFARAGAPFVIVAAVVPAWKAWHASIRRPHSAVMVSHDAT